MVTSNCAVCSSKKSRFIKEQEARGLLSSLAKRASLIRILLVGPILFLSYEINKIIKKYLLAGDKYYQKCI